MIDESRVENGELFISCLLNADISRVYQAWTDPEHLSKWMGPGSVVCESAEVDFCLGGEYRLAMRTDDGLMVAFGVYREIEPDQKLAFTWQWEGGSFTDSMVTISLQEEGGKTRLQLMQTQLPTEEVAQHHTQGWTGSLLNLEDYLK